MKTIRTLGKSIWYITSHIGDFRKYYTRQTVHWPPERNCNISDGLSRILGSEKPRGTNYWDEPTKEINRPFLDKIIRQ